MKFIIEGWRKFVNETAEDDKAYRDMDAEDKRRQDAPPSKYRVGEEWKSIDDKAHEELDTLVKAVKDVSEDDWANIVYGMLEGKPHMYLDSPSPEYDNIIEKVRAVMKLTGEDAGYIGMAVDQLLES